MILNKKYVFYNIFFAAFAVFVVINSNRLINIIIEFQYFSGTIIRKDLDRPLKHPIIYLEENDKEKYYDIGNIEIYKIIQPGDYIIKKKGTIDYILIKGKDTIIFQQ